MFARFRTVFPLLLSFAVCLPLFAEVRVDVHDFGAKGDGITIDSPAINDAIDCVSANGGGMVFLPKGTYMCFSVHLKSDVTLQFADGAVIKAAKVTDKGAYDDAEPNDSQYQDFGHSHWHNSLMWGENIHNVKLIGKGLIDGTDVLTRAGRMKRAGISQPTVANKALALCNCSNVVVQGISFKSCGHFAILFTGVDDVLIDDVVADTNRDGFDIDCCSRVKIRNCKVNTLNDDAIVLKCSYALGRLKPTEDVVIENCEVSGFDIGSLLDGTRTKLVQKAPDGDGPTGRIKLGTESNGGFRNIIIRDCKFEHCRGLALETVDGAPMENINISGLQMNDICNSPIYIRLGSRMRGPSTLSPSSVRNISISNVVANDVDCRYACLIVGEKGHLISDVSFENVSINYRGGLKLRDYELQQGTNPFFFHEGANYPEPSAHGIQPAWGVSMIYAQDITFKDFNLSLNTPDERKMIYRKHCKRVKGL